jgi:(p)ppGpp synthase/HD superfamily hydrolase
VTTASPLLGRRFGDALAYAHAAHRRQLRKGVGAPYIAHLLGVASLVIEAASEDGALTEDLAIAALLHDVAEDQGGRERLEDVARRFGPGVARVVEACSDSLEPDPAERPPWRQRKDAYLAHLEEADATVLRVSLADKLHNARSILLDYRTHGERLWSRFGTDTEVSWYYGALAELFQRRLPGPQADELARTVATLDALTS